VTTKIPFSTAAADASLCLRTCQL